jgi:hypothetical protein
LILSSAPGICPAFSSLIRRHLLHRIFPLCPAAAAFAPERDDGQLSPQYPPCTCRKSTVCQRGRTYRNRSTKSRNSCFRPARECNWGTAGTTIYEYLYSLTQVFCRMKRFYRFSVPISPRTPSSLSIPDLGLVSRFRPALLSSIITSRWRARRMETSEIRSSCC